MPKTRIKPGGRVAEIANSIVDPQAKLGKCRFEPLECGLIIASPHNRVEVGHIQLTKRMKRQKGARDVDGIAGGRQRRLDRPILVSMSPLGADNGATHQIDYRDDFHRSWSQRRVTAALRQASTGVVDRE